MLGVGMLITNITGNLNLKSSAKMRLNPYYLDPFVFIIILILDANRLVESDYLKLAYMSILTNRFYQYVFFIRGMIEQICDYMDIPFLRVKQDYKSKKHS
jgi:hypothetical protein